MRRFEMMLKKKAPTEPVVTAKSTAPADDESKHWPKTGKCYVTNSMFTVASRADWQKHVQDHHRPGGIPV